MVLARKTSLGCLLLASKLACSLSFHATRLILLHHFLEPFKKPLVHLLCLLGLLLLKYLRLHLMESWKWHLCLRKHFWPTPIVQRLRLQR